MNLFIPPNESAEMGNVHFFKEISVFIFISRYIDISVYLYLYRDNRTYILILGPFQLTANKSSCGAYSVPSTVLNAS